MRGKRGEVRGDGLLVANVHQHAVENRQERALRRHGNSRLRGQRCHSHGFQRHGFSAGVRAADDEHALLSTKRERHRNDRAVFFLQFVFENRMACVLQAQFVVDGKLRSGGIEIARKSRSRKNAVQLVEQRLLPHRFEIVRTPDFRETARAIKEMVVRGAGAIGATAAYGLAQGARAFRGCIVSYV